MRSSLFDTLADFCTNMSAGGFGVIIYTPSIYKFDRTDTITLLILNGIVSILFFGLSVKLKTKL